MSEHKKWKPFFGDSNPGNHMDSNHIVNWLVSFWSLQMDQTIERQKLQDKLLICLYFCVFLCELLFTKLQVIKRQVGLSGKDGQVVSFTAVCSTLLKQQVAGLNVSLQMFVIAWIISYTRYDLTTLVTELFLTQQFYKKKKPTSFLS